MLYDEETRQYSIVTIHKEVPIEEEEEGVAFATEIQKTELILYTFKHEFTLGVKCMQDNVIQGRVVLE